jgi:DNA-binding NarL/FixJ family response regulator
MAKIRVVLADDHIPIMVQIREVLGDQFEVLGSFVNGSQAVDATLRMDPDALILDVSMPVLNGIEAARQLQAANCRARIVFLSMHDDPDFISAAFLAGACGYVIKSRLSTDLVPAIREAMSGRRFVSERNVTSL